SYCAGPRVDVHCRMLAAQAQAFDQWEWQRRGAHALLDRGNVVWRAPKFDDLMLLVRDRKCCTRISVARLAHRTRIEQVAGTGFQTQGCKIRAVFRPQLDHVDLSRAIRKPALIMSVTKKSDWTGRFHQASQRLRGSEYIFIFVVKRAMDNGDAIERRRSLRQAANKG